MVSCFFAWATSFPFTILRMLYSVCESLGCSICGFKLLLVCCKWKFLQAEATSVAAGPQWQEAQAWCICNVLKGNGFPLFVFSSVFHTKELPTWAHFSLQRRHIMKHEDLTAVRHLLCFNRNLWNFKIKFATCKQQVIDSHLDSEVWIDDHAAQSELRLIF